MINKGTMSFLYRALIAVSAILLLTVGGVVVSAPSPFAAKEADVPQEYRILAQQTAELLGIEDIVDVEDVSFDQDQYAIYWNSLTDINCLCGGETYLDRDGHMICSYLYEGPVEGEPLGTREEMLRFAEDLIKRVIPEAVGHLQYNDGTDEFDEYYCYSFTREENGLTVPQNTIDMLINRTNGVCSSLNIDWDYETEFPAPGKLISAKKTIKNAKKQIVMPSLHYCKGNNIIIDEKTGKTVWENKVYLAYKPTVYRVQIDACSGGVSFDSFGSSPNSLQLSYYYDDGIPMDFFVEDENIEKTINKHGLIGSDIALQTVLSNKYLLIDSEVEEEPMIRLCKKLEDTGYIWIVSRYTENDRKNYAAFVDAKTGDLIFFSTDVMQEGDATDLRYTKKECKKTVRNFFKSLNKNRYLQTKLSNSGSWKSFRDLDTKQLKTGKYYFEYTRMCDGIPFNDNGAKIWVDRITGKITYFYTEWDEGVSFPEPNGVIDASKAYKNMYALSEYNPAYHIDYVEKDGKNIGTASVIYELYAFNDRIDAFTGEILDYNGNPICTSLGIDVDLKDFD
jgi:hypothetical protein